MHQHGYPVPLSCYLDRFSKHLHWLNFAFLLQLTQLYFLPRFYSPLDNSSSDNSPFALNLKAVIDKIQKFRIYLSFRNNYLIQEYLLKMIIMIFLLLFSRKRHYYQILPKFSLAKYLTQSIYLTFKQFLVLNYIHFVQHHYHFLHEELGYYYTLCSLRLNALCSINYQKHYVNYLGTSYYCSNQRSMTRTIN